MACLALALATGCGQSGTGRSVSGTVTGAVAGGVTLSLSGRADFVATTSVDGRYDLTGVASGSYALSPSRAGYVFQPPVITVTVAEADIANQDFAATALGGTLDVAFGGEGTVSTVMGATGGFANALAIQPDGRILAGGISAARSPGGAPASFALARYLPDGSLDASFGSSGAVTTAFGDSDSWVTGIAAQPDGGIVAAGVSDLGFSLARHDANGELDATFGVGGKVTTAVGTSSGAGAVVTMPDGAILAAGSALPGNGGSARFALVRFDRDGTLDPGFGSGGVVTTSVGGLQDGITAVAVRGDGRIVAAGYSLTDRPGTYAVALAQFDAQGNLDGSFGASGVATYSPGLGVSAWANGLAIQPDGGILVAGYAEATPSSGAAKKSLILRFDLDGTLDQGFGSAGLVMGEAGSSASAVAIDGSGKILFAGFVAPYPSPAHFLVARLNGDGSADQNFGLGGSVTTVLSPFSDSAKAVAIQGDGKIVAAGVSNDAGLGEIPVGFGLARYWP